MYTVSPQKYEELAPYIIIPEKPKRERTFTPKKAPSPVAKSQPAEITVQKQEDPPVLKEKTVTKVFIDLNEADSSALISVRGIGPYFCKAILAYRKALGSFASIDQLLEIRGMDQEKFDRIKDQVFVHPAGIKKFSIAEADRSFLSKHPYIGAYNARGIALFLQSHSKEECTPEFMLFCIKYIGSSVFPYFLDILAENEIPDFVKIAALRQDTYGSYLGLLHNPSNEVITTALTTEYDTAIFSPDALRLPENCQFAIFNLSKLKLNLFGNWELSTITGKTIISFR